MKWEILGQNMIFSRGTDSNWHLLSYVTSYGWVHLLLQRALSSRHVFLHLPLSPPSLVSGGYFLHYYLLHNILLAFQCRGFPPKRKDLSQLNHPCYRTIIFFLHSFGHSLYLTSLCDVPFLLLPKVCGVNTNPWCHSSLFTQREKSTYLYSTYRFILNRRNKIPI